MQPPEHSIEDLAIALLFKHRWGFRNIAEALRVNVKSLYKLKKLREAAIKLGVLKPRGPRSGKTRRGHKTSEGRVEAYDDQPEES
jgi:hypothetical protein